MSKIHLLFSEWLGKSPEEKFGFRPQIINEKKPFYLEQPIEEFKSSRMIEELVRLGPINNRILEKNWDTEICYGEGVGRMQVDVSPFGSFKIIMRRYVEDLKGNNTGVCRYVIPLVNDFNHKGPNDPSEYIYAEKIYDKLKQMDAEPLPHPAKDKYKEFSKVVYKFAEKCKIQHPAIMIYEGLQKINENNYLLSFNYSGYGNGLPNSQKVEKFLINWQYLNEQGIYHCWGYEVVSKSVTRTYLPAPSEWDEYFTPDQHDKTIVDCIHEAFMTY
jgi:hypothetical protein